MPHPALVITDLEKTFTEPAVDKLSLEIASGQIYALLGPNGAGKTTTLRMVAGLLKPDAGRIAVSGIDIGRDPIGAKAVTAWLPDEPLIYDRLSPREYLAFVAGLWQVPGEIAGRRTEALLEGLGLLAHGDKRCQGLSKGMRQKVALAGALVHEPKLIILDEPLTGLDAGSARHVKTVLRGHVERGNTVIMTTHILDVAERMADRIGVIARGRLIAEGTLDDLRSRAGRGEASLEDLFLELVADAEMEAAEQAEIAAQAAGDRAPAEREIAA